MEVAWEDRGKIAHDAFFMPSEYDQYLNWNYLGKQMKEWWNRVFDACVAAEKKMVPGGTTILVTGDNHGA